jgi:hypothetical protein
MTIDNRVQKALRASETFWGRLFFSKRELFKAYVQLYERFEDHAVHHATYVRQVQEAARKHREF